MLPILPNLGVFKNLFQKLPNVCKTFGNLFLIVTAELRKGMLCVNLDETFHMSIYMYLLFTCKIWLRYSQEQVRFTSQPVSQLAKNEPPTVWVGIGGQI